MADLIHSIASHLRRFVGDRRRAPRRHMQHEARLLFSASLLGEKIAPRDDSFPSTLKGYTRDISETGLALIVPDIQIDEHHLADANRALRIMLEFPGAPVALDVAPVRCQSLAQEGSLLCVKITRMSEHDRASFVKHLRKLHSPALDFIISAQAPHLSLIERGEGDRASAALGG